MARRRVGHRVAAGEDTARALASYFAEAAASKVRPAALSRRGPYGASLELRDAVWETLDAFAGSMSTRQLYYQMISRAVVDNSDRSYERVQRQLVRMRATGDLAHGRIVDRTRRKHHARGWDGPGEVMRQVSRHYRRDLWDEQTTVPMFALEKSALEGVVGEVVDEKGSPLWTFRGYPSVSFIYELAEEIREYIDAGKRVVIYYLGDLDPSGVDIERAARAALEGHGVAVEWHRLGLLLSDFEQFNLVRLAAKRSDSRFARYVRHFGDCAAELDALPPDELRRRVREALERHIDDEAWERRRVTEAAEKASLEMVSANWNKAVEAARAASGEHR